MEKQDYPAVVEGEQESVDRSQLVLLLRERGFEDMAVSEMLSRFSDALYPPITDSEPTLRIRVNAQIELMKLYYDSGYIEAAYEALGSAFDQAEMDNDTVAANELIPQLNQFGKRLFYPRTDYVPDAGQN